ncbi:Procollagen-lysine 2-oxoglutarate 5-dioxygenase [Seminavis robusta]|uniref:Procollagen-lysine 2-oxoglutarate 5-dioxygenase n=1 Tax=Seminavis robusta TaxID=568900 RepID=A0A9N8HCF0_9STRA|nr:Procollagen-lysine 2-oxoglutarate 5-dioxygenase [Seminavis robusta]|eukprot:Sro299_g111420.1 Procollagen-lysine 2-oxoglutarate 5-dioxygenase (528) ;mRNA; f:48977-50560
MSFQDFGGEAWLQVALPDFGSEIQTVTLLLIGNTIFWVFFLPVLTGILDYEEEEANNDKLKDGQGTTSSTNGKQQEKKAKTRTRRPSRDKAANGAAKISTTTDGDNHLNGKKKPKVADEVPPTTTAAHSVTGLLIGTMAIFLLWSPYNYYTSRRVFMAPLFTREECQHVIQMAHNAAQKNYDRTLEADQAREFADTIYDNDDDSDDDNDDYEEFQKDKILQLEPRGWQKTRHASYPTTDLNLVTDPFTGQDRAWLGQRFHARLAPLLSRIFGIPPRSIRANDMFVVRYDAPPDDNDDETVHRAYLANHTDDSDISFNILLNDEFEGGGTRFWDRLHQQPFALVQPTEPGTVLTHSALINHEGATVTKGTRMILVGFLSVDKVDPFHPDQSTGLSFWASWGSGSWLTTKFKQAHMIRKRGSSVPSPERGNQQKQWTNSVYVRRLILDLIGFFQVMGDAFGTHAVEDLVLRKDTQPFLETLDRAAEQQPLDVEKQAVWWYGQGLHLDVDGSIATEWKARKENKQAFEEL